MFRTPRIRRRARELEATFDFGDSLRRLRLRTPPRPNTKWLRLAAGQASVLMHLAAASIRDRDHGCAIDLLREAERQFSSVANSRAKDRWLAEILLRLGDALRLAGRYEDAGEALAKAENLAATDPALPLRLALISNAQGILAKDTGDFDGALSHYVDAQKVVETELGESDPALASIHHNLAGLLLAQERFAEAEQSARKAVALRERAVPLDPEGLAADRSVLGSVLLGLGHLREAEQEYLRSKSFWMDRYGPGHYEVAVQLNGLSTILQARGEFDAAEHGFREALRIKIQLLGSEHRESAALLNNLGALEMDRGHQDASVRLYDQALSAFRMSLGEEHPETRLCSENLARARSS